VIEEDAKVPMLPLRRLIRHGALAAALAFSAPALSQDSTLFVHGHIYTADPARPWAQALVVEGSHIAAVGSDRDLTGRWGAKSRVVDLKGQTVIPGIIDAHMHLLFGALEIAGFNLSTPEHSVTPAQPDALVAAIRAFAQAHPTERLLIGRADFSSEMPAAPTRALLDQAVRDRPVIVHNSTEHSLWVNGKALELAGVTDEPVADPEEERNVVRDASGHPTGLLLEAAQELVHRAVLRELSVEEKLALLREATRYLNRFGITSIVNATGNLAEVELYGRLRDRGELTVRTRTAFGAVAVPHRLTPQFLADLETARTRYHDEWVSANVVKFFADGSSGMYPPLVYRAADYRALVVELDRRGYQLMTHAERRDSIHMVLDAYENAVRANGPRDRRLRIEHDFVVDDADAAREGRLAVIAGAQPAFCCADVGTSYDPGDPTPSDRWHTLLALGAGLAFSSDWPCMWPPDPFVNMQQAVTRQIWRSPDTAGIETAPLDGANQGGAVPQPGRVYYPEERISVAEAVDAYTRGAAYASFFDDRVGSLQPGKLADLAVLSHDIFAVPAADIGKTRVTLTMVGGKVVYDAAATR
jgi:predicted amidohydrolase YtcJ